jgi:hypothetical protein
MDSKPAARSSSATALACPRTVLALKTVSRIVDGFAGRTLARLSWSA